MIIDLPNPSQVNLQVIAQNPDGTPKLNVATSNVRVYHMVGAVETDVLASTLMAQVGATSTWRYVWSPGALGVGQYIAEYTMVDTIPKTAIVGEDLVVRDFAKQVDLEIVKKIETGRWKIVGNQMLFFDTDGTTVLLTYNLLDDAGFPTMASVFERVPV